MWKFTITITWCKFEISYHNFEKCIKIRVDVMLFSEISDLFEFCLKLNCKSKGCGSIPDIVIYSGGRLRFYTYIHKNIIKVIIFQNGMGSLNTVPNPTLQTGVSRM